MGELPEYMVVFPYYLVSLRLNESVWWCSFESAPCLAAALQTQGPADIQEAESGNKSKLERVQHHWETLERELGRGE